MDDYPYATLGANGWFRCDGLHRPGFPTLLWDILHRFGYTGLPAYRGRPYCQFGLGRCKVHVDIPAHPTDPTMTAWFTTARGDDLDDTLKRAAHQALTEFCERHLPVLGDTAIAMLPIRNEGNAVWSERMTAISDPEFLTHHAGWALTARNTQHASSLVQEVTATSAHLRLHLGGCADQLKAKNRIVKDIQKGNTSLSMYLFCNSRIHVITLYSGRVCVYYVSMLWCWHLVRILVRTDQPCLGVGCHTRLASLAQRP
jgi:hypothetical protein